MTKTHNEYRDLYHAQSREAEWWHNSHLGHIEPVKMMLIVSELSEADEALGYKSFSVELADAAIRLYDLLGWYSADIPTLPHSDAMGFLTRESQLLLAINQISAAMERDRRGDKREAIDCLLTALAFVWSTATVHKIDLHEIMPARGVDHQPEHRNAANGKAY